MKKLLLSCAALFALTTSIQADDNSSLKIGVVNFKTCVEQSKLGKAEQTAFEALKEQMVTILEKTEKELDDLATKLGDEDHLDSLSQEAQNELKVKFQGLNQELARYQNQYYQILNQANFKLISDLTAKVGEAAKNVAKDKGYSLVLNEEATFYRDSSLEITNDVIIELDKRFDEEEKEFQKNANQPAKS
jgi:outer membrane protein